MTDNLKQELKNLIIETLNLEDITVADIKDDTQLFGDGMNLDSVDALEISVAIKKKYGVVIDPKDEDVQNFMLNVNNLANYIQTRLSNV